MKHRFPSVLAALRSGRTSALVAALLLASFVAGGYVAPTAHLVYHAAQEQAARQGAARCSPADPGTPTAERGGSQIDAVQCWVLARYAHLLDVPPPSRGQAAPSQKSTPLPAPSPLHHTSSAEGRFVIRGPPRA